MKIKDHFSNEEIQHFCERSDGLAWFAIVSNWLMIAGIFALVAVWTNPFTILLALILFGGRQLGLGALMHECGHGTLFQSKKLNKFVGHWLCAAPVIYRLDDYMSNHLAHHAKAGSEQDPDLSRYQNYPVSQQSLNRKLLRDMSGRTSLNFLETTMKRHGVFELDEQRNRKINFLNLWKSFHASIIMNALMIATLAWFGIAYLYILWVAAYFSFYMVFSRIRNLAEHACVPDLFNPDPMLHTRTTLASWWEKLTFAPNNVNYHLEHHLLPSVPKYKLESFHRALSEKDLLQTADIESGYLSLSKRLVTAS